ncbi:MAG: hypothetical protein P4M13_06775 [Alphaproteobacteria bacterium]|nr:hypothetical protein [Alphaproteobacteria bacterium]
MPPAHGVDVDEGNRPGGIQCGLHIDAWDAIMREIGYLERELGTRPIRDK